MSFTLEDLRKRSFKLYWKYLLSLVFEEEIFPLQLDFSKNFSHFEYSSLIEFQQLLSRYQKSESLMHGLSIDFKAVNSRRFGQQTLPSKIYFESPSDLLSFVGKIEEVQKFKNVIELAKNDYPFFFEFLRSNPKWIKKVVENLHLFPEALRVCKFFIENPKPNQYVRELPIEVHTKFIESNQGFLRTLLFDILPADCYNKNEKKFERIFFLKENPSFVRLKFVDDELLSLQGLPFNDFMIRIEDFNKQVHLSGLRIIITENLNCYLNLPRMQGTVAIFGMGMGVTVLNEAVWMKTNPIYYWGDLDVQGFEILSYLREAFPQTLSVLMDFKTFETFEEFKVPGVVSNRTIYNLNLDEQEMCHYLRHKNLRLEQEKLTKEFVHNVFERLDLIRID